MPSSTRRRLLGSAAAAGAATLLPTNVQNAIAASAANPRPGKFSDIKHVVLLMQENRSFDHYFGTLSGVAGFDDPEAITLSTGRSVFYQPDSVNPDGYTLPFHLNTSSAQAISSTSHAWSVQHQVLNGGANDNWLPAHRAADGATGAGPPPAGLSGQREGRVSFRGLPPDGPFVVRRRRTRARKRSGVPVRVVRPPSCTTFRLR